MKTTQTPSLLSKIVQLDHDSTHFKLLIISLGVLLLYAASQCTIPLRPVPITLQTMAVLLLGTTYPPAAAACSIAIWLLLGNIGLPLFAVTTHAFANLTAGYRIGFLVAVTLMAGIRKKIGLQRSWHLLLNCLFGLFLIYFCGITWLTYFFPFTQAVVFGLYPFVLPELGKAILLVAILRVIRYKK